MKPVVCLLMASLLACSATNLYAQGGATLAPPTAPPSDPFVKGKAAPAVPAKPEAAEPAAPAKPAPGGAPDPNIVNLEIDFAFIAFPMKEIEDMARKSTSASPTQEQLKEAWKAGQGKLVATTKVTTLPGQQAKNEAIEEIIYATEYDSGTHGTITTSSDAKVNKDKETGTTTTSTETKTTPATSTSLEFPVPGGFQTRNSGLSVNATPMLSEDGRHISLTSIPELSENEWASVDVSQKWISGDPATRTGDTEKTLALQQPGIHTRRLTSNIILHIDETLVTGGLWNRDHSEVTYLFITGKVLPFAP